MMPETKSVAVKDLALDLHNYRTVKQTKEASAIEAMIVARGDRFWALMESLLADGYLPTESIIVMRAGSPPKLTVREGNRRVAALKLIHGYLPLAKFEVPDSIKDEIKAVTDEWKAANASVPCTIYTTKDEETVDRIVRLAHGKGEKASRDQWNAIARARHNRDENHKSEPALDLLEHYLRVGKNITPDQKTRWAGVYPLSVLDEAMKKLAQRLGVANAPALAQAYPSKISQRTGLEAIIADVGREAIGFDQIREKTKDFAAAYGVPPLQQGAAGGASAKGASGSGATGNAGSTGRSSSSSGTATSTGGSAGGASSAGKSKHNAAATSDPKAVRRALKNFVPKGDNRAKVVDLKLEAEKLDLAKTPLAFSFVLRSMFEISAKAYCVDHGLKTTKSDGNDKKLVDLLRDIKNHLTNGNKDREMLHRLHGAMTELAKQDGLLSVTSLNQLVHNPHFSVTGSEVATRFGKIFPLLQAMNE